MAIPLRQAPTDGSGDIAAPSDAQPDRSVVYRSINGVDLHLHLFMPTGPSRPRPGIVFFHGGAWRKGSPSQFFWQARHLAERGMVAISTQYRLIKHGATRVADCIDDARAAFRHVRAHAADFGIDPTRLAAGGGSAGGHLAACLGTLSDPAADPVSSKPDLLVLFNPALFHRAAEETLALSDFTADTPPAIFFLGDQDEMVVYARDCLAQGRRLGNEVELHLAAGESHGFFNHPPWREATLYAADRFLATHGFLTGEPVLLVDPTDLLRRTDAPHP